MIDPERCGPVRDTNLGFGVRLMVMTLCAEGLFLTDSCSLVYVVIRVYPNGYTKKPVSRCSDKQPERLKRLHRLFATSNDYTSPMLIYLSASILFE